MRKVPAATLTILWGVLPLSALVSGPPDPVVPSEDQVFAYLGFEASEKRDLYSGKIIQNAIHEGNETELAVTLAMLVPCRLEKVVEAFRTGLSFEADRDVLSYRDLGPGPAREEDFNALSLSGEELREVRKLFSVEPGSTFNLSHGEIEIFREAGRRFPRRNPEKDPASAEEAAKGWRRVLHGRVRAYQEKGLKAIAPYARGRTAESSPGAELRSAGEAAKLIEEHFPDFYRNFLEFPAGAVKEFEHRFYWIKQRVEDRPGFVLVHRTFYQRPEGALITERHLYVSHSYNSLQIIMGCLPAGEKTLVFYTNRTFTDQVAGFASGLRHSIGRKRLSAKIVSEFEEIRARAKKAAGGG